MTTWIDVPAAIVELRKRPDLKRCDIPKTIREAFANAEAFVRRVPTKQVDLDAFIWIPPPLLAAGSVNPFNPVAELARITRKQAEAQIVTLQNLLLLTNPQLEARGYGGAGLFGLESGAVQFVPGSQTGGAIRAAIESDLARTQEYLSTLYPADLAAGL